ncbi:MAG: DUF2490 domain-containing protein [Deltaproteobacteria bacterium]|nr:DUF2490 domain-containing protein [Deltaproteobacteria bacterium]
MKRAIMICFIMLVSSRVVLAASGTETEGWFELKLQHNIISNAAISLSAQFRLDEKISHISAGIIESEGEFRFFKHLSIAAGYRFAHNRLKDDGYEPVHRVYANISGRLPLDYWRLKYRLQAQNQWDWTSKGVRKDKTTLRNRITIEYKINKTIRPYIAVEHFLPVDTYKNHLTNKCWFTIGTELQIADAQIEPFYRYELPFENPNDPVIHIIGISMQFEPLLSQK